MGITSAASLSSSLHCHTNQRAIRRLQLRNQLGSLINHLPTAPLGWYSSRSSSPLPLLARRVLTHCVLTLAGTRREILIWRRRSLL